MVLGHRTQTARRQGSQRKGDGFEVIGVAVRVGEAQGGGEAGRGSR